MRVCLFLALFVISLGASPAAFADELTKMAQQDLTTLGYDPGNTTGEATTKTVVAISKFQAEHDLAVTGEASPQLIGALRAAIKQQNSPGVAAAPAVAPQSAPPVRDEAALKAAQQACLQEKYEAAQASQKKKRGLGRLMSAISRTSSQFGGGGVASTIGQVSSDVYSVTATADDLSGAAKDLGLTEDEVEQCRNPQ
jgi:peptidoglycan hydrolase-like protein with peptidoglycan-binding domain